MNATDPHLREGIRDQPLGIHFAMHGFRNPKPEMKDGKPVNKKNKNVPKFCENALKFYKNKGDFLLFENPDGSASFFHEDDLDDLN